MSGTPSVERGTDVGDRAARRLSRAAFALVATGYAASIVVTVLGHAGASLGAWGGNGTLGDYLFVATSFSFPAVGFVILSKQPRNTIGWLFIAVGGVWALSGLADTYGRYGLAHPGSLPGPAYVLAANEGSWAPGIGLIGTFLILLFPDGHLPSPSWRWVARLSAVAIVAAMLGVSLSPGTLDVAGYSHLRNPLGVGAIGVIGEILLIGIPLLPLSIVLSAIALVRRYRRSAGQVRMQLKWLASAAAIIASLYLLAVAFGIGDAFTGTKDASWVVAIQTVAVLSFFLIPVACGLAILKHRLYDIDVVINRALVYGTLAAFISAVYVAIVVGIGAAFGAVGHPNLGLSILATAVVAVVFGPVKERVQRVANRIVYGDRSTPYEVLSRFSSRLSGTYAVDELLPRMAEMLAEGTGAHGTGIWLRVGDEVRLEGAWPAIDRLRPLGRSEPPEADDRSRVVSVSHRGETLGWIVVRKAAGDPFTETEAKLVSDVAAQAGLVLRNVHLVEELRASRQRLVAAQDAERRKLERNIHDGAQQRLVALAVRFNLARRLVGAEGNGAAEAIARLAEETQAALENLRDLARGIYPPLLADRGLVAALDAQARKAPLPVTILATGVERYPQDVEAAVYFCCLEALQNVAKHAAARAGVVRLEGSDGDLAFEIEDDGAGFDPSATPLGSGLTNMTDRLAALGGTLEVRSRPGGGTTVAGRVAVRSRQAVPA